jgi:hypothetical protein
MAPGNYEQMVHYEDTIKNRVAPDRIFKYLNFNLKNRLKHIFGSKLIAVWGSRNTDSNRSKFERMMPGDDIIIVEGNTIKLLGKVADKTINSDLSRELWKNIKGKTKEGWDLIYFIANPLEIDLPFSEFNKLFGYKSNYSLRGFTSISKDRLEKFYSKYDDLYSILQRIKQGDEFIVKEDNSLMDDYAAELTAEDIQEILDDSELSEHIKMQWKLIRLGLKAGSKVWIPKNDQSRIKEEFRIDAAFEVENTTSIYSGLLRFSDLKIIAPNSIYPLFIVAPLSKRNRFIEQIKRPTFRKIDFDKKVRYISFESLNEVDKFFESSTSGLNVDLLVGKSEVIS